MRRGHVRPRHWFLPEVPDVLALLAEQGQVTIAGIEAFRAWAEGDAGREADLRRLEHEADDASRRVLDALRTAFVTAISPEDAYELSERLDTVLNRAKNIVREADVLAMAPDGPMADMAALVASGVHELVAAFSELVDDGAKATAHADAAVRRQRDLEHVYRTAMSALLSIEDVRTVIGRRELYRRCARLGDAVEGVAHRIWYAVVKSD